MFTKVRKDLSVRIILVLAFFFGWPEVTPVQASTMAQVGPNFIVNTNEDHDDGFCDTFINGLSDCTLREAINASNGDIVANEITFADNYTITLDGSQLPAVTSELTITGNGAANTILQANANPDTATNRVLHLKDTGNLTLNDLTIRNGQCNGACPTGGYTGGGILASSDSAGGGILNFGGTLTITNSTISGNSASGNGGGIFSFGGTVTMANSILSNNSASGDGGGILSYGTLTLTNSLLSNNSASGNGGGIRNDGTLTVTDGIFTTNLASKGGGIYNFSGTLTVTNSTLSSNSASNSGGGIYNNTGSLTMTNSTLFNNSAGYSGGSIANLDEMMVVNSTLFNNSAAYAGGIYSYSGTVMNSVLYNNSATYGGGISNYGPLTVMNSTLSNNLATYSGGGIYNWGALTVTNSTLSNNSANNGGGISNNYAATTLLYNTLIVDSPSGLNCVRSGGTLTANSFNMDTDGSCDNAAEMSSAQINLQPLSDNGGPTQTHALGAGSLAIDAGNDSNCPATDQRGVTRPQGGHCDIGAYEKIVHYVKSNAGGLNDGSSWTNAYTDLQSALSVASSGDEIWVAAGTYKPTTGTDRTISFTLKNGVAIYGGFAGTENLCNQRNWELNITTLSGDIGVLGDNIDNSYHVVIGVSGAILDGFTITGGHADGTNSPHWHGGGMLNVSGSSPTLTNLILAENFADNDGGGMANLWNSSPLLTNVIFIHNKASGGGGGMYSQDGNSTLYNVVFENNEADIGGGLLTSSDYSTLMNVTFGKNKANFAGGGMFNSHGSPMLANVTFSGNSATHHGGGMVTDYYNAPMLNNVTFANNTAGYQAGGISITNVSEAIITNAIFWNNSAPDGPEIYIRNSAPTISNSIVEGGCPTGITCNNVINANPKLDILANNGGLTKTQALLTDSPAIDAGDDATCAATDQRGVTRPQGSHCDIGAYEYNSADVNVTIGGNSVGTYSLDPGERTSPRYGINGGPVHVVSTNGKPIFTSQRTIYGSSFNSIVGYPGNQLTTEYWFTSLDDLGMITYLVIGNPSTTLTAHVDVYIAGNKMNPTPYEIAPGQRVFPRYGINGGPVQVVSDIPIFTSERTKYGNSFNEVLGYPANQLTTEYWFTSLDDLGMITYLVIGNPSTVDTALVDVYIAGNKMNTTPYSIAPGQRVFPRYGINGGPVQVVSTNGVPIFTSERTKYGNSFNEVLGYPDSKLTTESWFTSLDDAGMITYLVIGNPSTTLTANVDVYIAGNKMNPTPYAIAPGQRVFPRYGINGGPVQVVSDIPIFTSERSKFQSSFNEILGIPNTELTTDYWFTSLDDLGMITELVIAAP